MYDPKSRFSNKMKTLLPYVVKYCEIPIKNFLDDGLLLMTNIKPHKTGSETFEACACDDSLANKGFIWCYFDEHKLLLINTHLQAAGPGRERLAQVRQIRRFLNKISKKNEIHRIIIIGDFNVDMQTHHARIKIYNESLNNLNSSDNNNINAPIENPNNVIAVSNNNNTNNNTNNNSLIVEMKKTLKKKENNSHLLEGFDNYSNDVNQQLIHETQIVQDDQSECHTENHEVINEQNKENTKINIELSENINNTNNNNNNDDNKSNNIKNGINNKDQVSIHYDLQLPLHNDQYSDIDPLTQIPYDALPREMIPDAILQKKAKYVKKSYLNLPYYLGPKFIKLNGYEITFKRAKYNIDHIFANFDVHDIVNETYAEDLKILSDHRLIICQFRINPQ